MILQPPFTNKAPVWVWLAILALAGLCLPAPGADESISLKYTYRPEQTQVSVLHDIQGKTYLPLADTAQFYGVQMTFDSQTRRVALTKGKNQVKLVLSQPVFLTVDPEVSYPMEPVEVISGQLGIPPESAEDIFSAILNVGVRFLPEKQLLVAGGIAADELKKEVLSVEQEKLASPLPAAAPVPLAQATPVSKPSPVEEAENEDESPAPGQTGDAGGGGEEAPADQMLRVRRIVIDPGHGGRDIGAKGFDKKYCEKQATLDIGKRVAQILRQEGDLDVFMTRDRDKYISLKYRTEFANRNNADLFVSIHCNSNPRSLATGTETYIYSARPSNKLAAVAAVSENEGSNDIISWLADLHHQKYNNLSFTLAHAVDDRIRQRLNQHIRRVLHAPFYVLRQVDMPSILIETAFISNKTEEIKLKDPYWRDKIAKAIADGILSYKNLVEGKSENEQARR